MTIFKSIVFVALLSVSTASHAETIFYLHGKIVEDKGDNAVHSIYGTYEYGNIIASLKKTGHPVISEIRVSGTDRLVYASRLVDEIRKLITAGTSPDDIVVIGFSKGAQIALLVSQQLAHPEVRFAIQAVCGSWLDQHKDLRLYGSFLSQYETSDSAGSCDSLFQRNSPIANCELSVSTGLAHGAFYRPIDEWMIPLKKWIIEGRCE